MIKDPMSLDLTPYPWVKGGVEKRIYELATRLAKKHEVHIYGYRHWAGDHVVDERDF